MSELTHDTFAGREGQVFRIGRNGAQPVEMVLQAVEVHDSAAGGGTTGFTLTFRAAGELVPQGTYLFEHEELGATPIFVVPIARVDGGHLYEAVFTQAPES